MNWRNGIASGEANPSLIRAMALSGCTGVFVGFESRTDVRRVRLLHENGIQVNGSFVLGFDHDRKDVFARTAEWIGEKRLECATFHILTPYPTPPLFRQMELQGRLLHRDWSLYDTGMQCSGQNTCRRKNWSMGTRGFGGEGRRIGWR